MVQSVTSIAVDMTSPIVSEKQKKLIIQVLLFSN